MNTNAFRNFRDNLRKSSVKIICAALATAALFTCCIGFAGCELIQNTFGGGIRYNTQSEEVQPSENFVKVEYSKSLTEYTGEEKIDIFLQNYAENNDFTFDRLEIVKSNDKLSGDSVTLLKFVNCRDKVWIYLDVYLPYEEYEECAKLIGKDQKTTGEIVIYIKKNKEVYAKLSDYLWEQMSSNHTMSAREEQELFNNSPELQLEAAFRRVDKLLSPRMKFECFYSFVIEKSLKQDNSYSYGITANYTAAAVESDGSYSYIITPDHVERTEGSSNGTSDYYDRYLCDISEDEYDVFKGLTSAKPETIYDQNNQIKTETFTIIVENEPEVYKLIAKIALDRFKEKWAPLLDSGIFDKDRGFIVSSRVTVNFD